MNHDGQTFNNKTYPQKSIYQQSINNIYDIFPQQLTQSTQIDSFPLMENQLNFKGQFDRELIIRNLDEKEPSLQNRQLYGNKELSLEHNHHHQDFDKEFAFSNLDSKQPQIINTVFLPHPTLKDNQLNKQNQYDQQAYIQEIDKSQPNIIQLKIKEDQQIQKARLIAIDNDLLIGNKQENIQIKSVKDVYVDKRIYFNQGVFPLENFGQFQEENQVGEMQITVVRNKAVMKGLISNNLYKNKEKFKRIQENQGDDDEWQTNIHKTLFSKQINRNNYSKPDKVEKNTNIKNESNNSLQEYKTQSFTHLYKNPYANSIKGNPLVEYAKAIHPIHPLKKQINTSHIKSRK